MDDNRLNINVLYVEDDDVFREHLEMIVSPLVQNFFTASNGKLGLEAVQKNNIDLVISDISMPVMNGIEMSRILKQNNKNIKIIILSTLQKSSYLTDAINIGIDNVVDKDLGYDKEIVYLIQKIAEEIQLKRDLDIQYERNLNLSAAIEQSAGILVITDNAGYIEYVNKKFISEFGFSSEEIIGKKISEFKSSDYAQLLEKALLGESASGEFLHKTKSGNEIWVSCNLSPVRNKNGEISGYVEVSEEITARKEMEENLRKSRKAAEDLSHSKSVFMATMSHELRTPLNGIIGMTSLLLSTQLDSKQKEYILLLKNSAEALLKIINDILEISEIESGKVFIDEKTFNIRKFVKSIIDFYAISAMSKKLELSYEIEANVPDFIVSDPQKIRQILSNLIGNSVKFTEAGYINLRVVQSSSQSDSAINFIIEDTGIGISEEGQKILFERFTQIDSSYTRKFGGTGLGLSISNELAELLKGKIEVNSTLGKGSVFTLTIPFEEAIKEVSPESRKRPYREFINSSRGGQSLNILVAEDNKINQKIIQELLKKLNHTVTLADNGLSAVQKFDPGVYDMIILDLEMPVMNGFDAAKNIQKLIKNDEDRIPIIALTAHSGKEVEQRAYASGMHYFAQKPIDLIGLRNVINKAFKDTRDEGDDDTPFDLSELITHFNNNPDGLKNYLKLFLDNIPENLSIIENDLLRKNTDNLSNSLDKMFTTLETIKANTAKTIVKDMINKTNDFGAIRALFNDFLIEIKKIENFLNKYTR